MHRKKDLALNGGGFALAAQRVGFGAGGKAKIAGKLVDAGGRCVASGVRTVAHAAALTSVPVRKRPILVS